MRIIRTIRISDNSRYKPSTLGFSFFIKWNRQMSSLFCFPVWADFIHLLKYNVPLWGLRKIKDIAFGSLEKAVCTADWKPLTEVTPQYRVKSLSSLEKSIMNSQQEITKVSQNKCKLGVGHLMDYKRVLEITVL